MPEPAWFPSLDDSFAAPGADTEAGGPQSNTGVPTAPALGLTNNWYDFTGSCFRKLSGQCQTVSSLGWQGAYLYRGAAENAVDQRVVVTYPPGSQPTNVYLRFQGGTGQCFCVFAISGGYFAWLSAANSFEGNTGHTPWSYTYNSAHTYTVDCRVWGVGPTNYSVTITEVETAAVVASDAGTTTSGPTAAGGVGFCSGLDGFVSRVQGYGSAFKIGSVVPDLAGTTPDAIRFNVIAPVGGNSPVTQSLWRHTASDFTPPGQGTLVADVTGLAAYTDAAPGGAAGDIRFYKLRAVDSTAGTPAVVTGVSVAACTKFPVWKLGFVGDDAFAALVGSYPAAFPGAFAARFLLHGAACTGAAVAGTSTADWVAGSANADAAVAAFAAAGCTHAVWMLGANDCRAPNFFSAAAYRAQASSGIGALVAAGLKVIVCRPYLCCPQNAPAGPWTDQSNDLLVAYWDQLATLVNGTTVLAGDRLATRTFAMNPVTDFDVGDPIRPSPPPNGVSQLAADLSVSVGSALGLTTSPAAAPAAPPPPPGGGYSRAQVVGGA